MQPAPSPLDDILQGVYRDHPTQPWLLQGQRQARLFLSSQLVSLSS
jgi:hypothetical protein